MNDYIDTNISVIPYVGANGNVGWGIQRHADGRMFNFWKVCWTRDSYTPACWKDRPPMAAYTMLCECPVYEIEDDITLHDKEEYKRRAAALQRGER